MITEDYVSFEVAKLLKEKEFDEPCYAYWHENENRLIFSYSIHAIRNFTNPCFFGPAAPTLQKAMKWLREVHNIAIETEWEHLWYAYIKPMTAKPSEKDCYQCGSSKYEDACEMAIRHSLENLIS